MLLARKSSIKQEARARRGPKERLPGGLAKWCVADLNRTGDLTIFSRTLHQLSYSDHLTHHSPNVGQFSTRSATEAKGLQQAGQAGRGVQAVSSRPSGLLFYSTITLSRLTICSLRAEVQRQRLCYRLKLFDLVSNAPDSCRRLTVYEGGLRWKEYRYNVVFLMKSPHGVRELIGPFHDQKDSLTQSRTGVVSDPTDC